MKKLLLIVICLAVIAGGLFLFKKYKLQSSGAQTNPTNSQTAPASTSTDQNVSSIQTLQNDPTTPNSVAPSFMIYKTKRDYSDLVWVELSADKTKVIAYPDPKDILNQIPIQMHDGYYSGSVDADTSFVNIKIEKYATFKTLFSPQQLYSLIINKNPFAELYNCGPKTGLGQITAINTLIDSNKLYTQCSKII